VRPAHADRAAPHARPMQIEEIRALFMLIE